VEDHPLSEEAAVCETCHKTILASGGDYCESCLAEHVKEIPIKAYCRNCNEVRGHRHDTLDQTHSELVCNTCNWIAITFHIPVSVSLS